MKRKSIIVSIILLLSALALVCIIRETRKQPIDCLREYATDPIIKVTEVLCQEYANDRYLVFYLNERGNACCGILRKTLFSYKVLRISGEVLLVNPNENADCHFSAFNDCRKWTRQEEWIDWGIVRDDKVTQVLVDGQPSKLIHTNMSDYRIYYMLRIGTLGSFPVETLEY